MTDLEVLGLAEGASAQEVELRWRELRSSLHPDRGGDAGQFDAAKKAYERALAEAQAPRPCPTCRGARTVSIVRGFNAVTVCCSNCGGTGEAP